EARPWTTQPFAGPGAPKTFTPWSPDRTQVHSGRRRADGARTYDSTRSVSHVSLLLRLARDVQLRHRCDGVLSRGLRHAAKIRPRCGDCWHRNTFVKRPNG